MYMYEAVSTRFGKSLCYTYMYLPGVFQQALIPLMVISHYLILHSFSLHYGYGYQGIPAAT